MHFWYCSTNFFIPSKKILFRLLMKLHWHRLLVWAPNVHTFYRTPSHHSLWLMQIHSWCSRLPPHVVMWFIKPSTLWSSLHDSDRRPDRHRHLHLFFSLESGLSAHTLFVDSWCVRQHLVMDFRRFDSLHTKSALQSDFLAPCHSTERWNVECLLFLQHNFKMPFTFWFTTVLLLHCVLLQPSNKWFRWSWR